MKNNNVNTKKILFLIPYVYNITIDMKKYIITTPVSGSKNVKTAGISVNRKISENIFKLSLKVLILPFLQIHLAEMNLILV